MQQDGELSTTGDSSVNTSTSTREKPWSRPWDLSEIREHAPKWNLAADAGLLKYLEAFSIDFMRKVQESTKQINDLMHDTNMADVKVRNVTGKFMTLSDSQFIENRVYDEDVSADASSDDKNEKESTEADVDPFPKLKTAIQMGIQVLEDSFDVLDPDAANSDIDSDLDSDEEQGNGIAGQVIYEPKDPYVTRPLPHLIGSRGFLESDDVGIRDLPSDDEIAQDDQGSISESDDDVEKLSYRKDSISSSESDISDVSDSDFSENDDLKPDATKFSSSSDSDDDGDLFAESDSDRNENIPVQKTAPKPKSKSMSKRAEKAKTAPKNEDLFDSDDDNDLFEDSGGLFGNAPNLFDKKTKKGGLFDGADLSDEDSQNSLDDQDDESQKLSSEEEVEHPVEAQKSSKPMGGIALFGGALNKELLKKTRKDSSTSDSDFHESEKFPVKKSDDLFAGDDSDEDDLFSEKPAPKLESKKDKSPAKKKAPQLKPVSDLFGDTSDDDDQFPKKAAPKLEVKNDKSPPTTKKPPQRKPAPDLFGDSSDDDDNDMLFGDAPDKPARKKAPPKPCPQTDSQKKSSDKKPAIFDSESSDDGMFSRKPPAAKSKQPDLSKKVKDLFGSESDDDFFTDVKSTPKPSAKTKSFLDSDSGDDLFSNTGTAAKKDTPAKLIASPDALFDESDRDDKPASVKRADAKKSDGLFDSSDEDKDEKQETPPPVRKKPVGAVSMFAGGFGGGELSAAILKRRGVSDASTKSSNDDFSDAEKAGDKKLGDILEDKKMKEGISDKKSELNVNVNSRKSLPKMPTKSSKDDSSGVEEFGEKKLGDISEDKEDVSDKKSELNVNSQKSLRKLPLNTTAKPFKPTASPQKVKSPQSSSVSNIRNTLSINPASLLPGAAPKPKPVVKTEISFDKPPTVNTLESVNKTRAKGQRNRRPPTRHSRGRPASNPITVSQPSTAKGARDEDISSKLESFEPSSKLADTVSAKKKDTFSTADKNDDFDDNLFDDASRVPKPKSLLDSAELDEELFSGSSLFAKTTKSKGASKAPKLFDDDIFGDDDDFMSGFAAKKKLKPETVAKVANDEDEDIFGDLNIGSVSKNKDIGKVVKSAVSDDDLFGDDTSVPVNGKDRSSSKNNFLDDEDDIFGESGATKLKTKSGAKSPDDFDIFGETPSVIDAKKPVKTKPQPGDDIFGDDIFTNTATSKKKSKKVDKKPKTAGTSIFDDDDGMDDIFAASSSKKKKAPSKQGNATKSTAPKQSKPEPSAVLDDPLSMP